jgi:hypothetical protein
MRKRTIGLALSAILISGSIACGDERSDEITFVPPGYSAQAERIITVTALPTGGILLDGKSATIENLGKILAAARGKVLVWYHRDPAQPATEAQRRVFTVLLDNKAPVSFSAKPDFSDYVDEHGQSHPRGPWGIKF